MKERGLAHPDRIIGLWSRPVKPGLNACDSIQKCRQGDGNRPLSYEISLKFIDLSYTRRAFNTMNQ